MLPRRVLPPPWYAVLAAASLSCSPAADGGDGVAPSEAAVTSVEATNVKHQGIGNCWLYATAGWAESLHAGATGREVDLSEAYWNMWFWYEQITGGEVGNFSAAATDGVRVDEAGFWGLAAEIIRRYGFMYEGDFIAAADPNGARHGQALRAINASLKGGALAKPESRKDAALVRRELYAAWRLDPPVVADLEQVFAASLDARSPDAAYPAIADRAQEGSLGVTRVHAPQELPVLGADGQKVVTLADVVGVPRPGRRMSDGARLGDEAWGDRRYRWPNTPAGRLRGRAFLKNVQAILNRRLAVPFIWWTTSTAERGVYRGEGIEPAEVRAMHVSIFVDYEVEDVPGYGTLRVGQRETREAALEAALDDAARVTFFRIKNSWGDDPGWSAEERRQYGISELEARGSRKGHYLPDRPGYNDLYVSFLDRPQPTWGDTENMHMLAQLTLPPQLRFAIPD